MLDRIDERDKQERMHRSIVKYWNVNYIPSSTGPLTRSKYSAAKYAGTRG